MERKKDILWRVYLCFLGITALCFCVLGRAFYIQQVQGNYWRRLSDTTHQKNIPISAERGSIFSADSNLLSTSIPYYDVYIDFGADGLREKDGKRFRENVDTLSLALANLFADQSEGAYRNELWKGFKEKDRFYELQKNVNFEQYKVLRALPLVRQGSNKSGFIFKLNSKRLNPFGLLANRTIGLSRDNAQKVGLERSYDSVLKGEAGKETIRYLSSGTYIPVEGSEMEPENGKDIATTLDVHMQDIAENALLKMMVENEAEHGTCVVMEVSTGKIKAMANLGRQPDGSYWEDLNYAIRATEPGSTFKLATLLSLLEDHQVQLSDHLNIQGPWKVGTRTVRDVEKDGVTDVTVKQAFERSSNIGMAKLTLTHYGKDPMAFVRHLQQLRLNQVTGIDLAGETSPIVKTPKSKTWSASTLPWMAFGYEVLVSPLQTLSLYNAVANDGKMMKPYLVSSVQVAGRVIRQQEPQVLVEHICDEPTLAQLKECLRGVCTEGTAKGVFKDAFYTAAGKTGTALVANGSRGYADHIYQSSFAGYFPSEHPRYSCIVVIKNKPFAKKFLGAAVAGPVFREVADKVESQQADYLRSPQPTHGAIDSAQYYYAGATLSLRRVADGLHLPLRDSAGTCAYANLFRAGTTAVLHPRNPDHTRIPDVKGMGLRDALALLENMHLKVQASGIGKVRAQSLEPGVVVSKNQTLTLLLN